MEDTEQLLLPDPTSRELCPLERWYWLFDKVSPLNGIVSIRVEGGLETGSFTRALEVLQRRHPLLRSKVLTDERGGRPRFVVDDSLVIPVIRERLEGAGREDDAWVDYARASILNTRFDTEKGPLARFALLDDDDGTVIVLYISHAIVDATGGMALMRELLQVVEGDGDEEKIFPLMPSLSDRFPAREHGFLAFLRAMWLQIKRELWVFVNRPTRLTADEPVPFAERVTDFLHRKLTREETTRLLAACRSNGASIQAALCASLLYAMAEDIRRRQEVPPEKPLTLGVGCPVTLRSGVVPPAHERELGIFVGTFMTWIANVEERDFWDIAREYGDDLRRQAADGEAFTILNFVRKTLPSSVERAGGYMKLLDDKGPGNATISNLGRFDFPERIGSLTTSNAQMVAEVSVTGTWVGVVNTCHGQLVWNFSYAQGIFTRERAIRLADRCMQRLRAEIDAATP